MPAEPGMRIDRFLWFARLSKSRDTARAMAEAGHMRIDGQRIDRAHRIVHPGQVLTFVHGGRVRTVRIEALPVRRGPAPEAQSCYRDVDGGDARI